MSGVENPPKRQKLEAHAAEAEMEVAHANDAPTPSAGSGDDGQRDGDAGGAAAPRRKRTGYDWYENQLGAPKHICAPMVDQSELAFRLLCLDHNVDLCYTPMLNSKMFLSQGKKFRDREFSTHEREKGRVIAQFCGDSPDTVLAAARMIEHQVDGVDLNCGCPQGIARKGHYGSYLLNEPDLICGIIKNLADNLQHAPATCKIRKVNNSNTYQETLNLCERLVHSGASAICIHGRTKEEKGQHTKNADWEVARIIKARIRSIPIFCNGGIANYTDVVNCFEHTKCDAVMSAEGLLEDPQLFSRAPRVSQDAVMAQYLRYAVECNHRLKTVKSHAFHFLYAGLQTCTDVRDLVARSGSVADVGRAAALLRSRREADAAIPQLGWYARYRSPIGGKDKKSGESGGAGGGAPSAQKAAAAAAGGEGGVGA